MIVLSDFRVEEAGDEVAASCAIRGEGFPERLVFRTDKAQADMIEIGEPNWAAVALYYQAMKLGQDMVVEADLSPRLLYNLRNDLMALFRSYEPTLQPVRIEAGMSAGQHAPRARRGVATGFSGGVDSFCTTMLYDGPDVPEQLRLNTLAIFHVGAFGPTSDPASEGPYEKASQEARDYAAHKGYRFCRVSANMTEVFDAAGVTGAKGFVKTVGLRNVAAAMVLQGGLSAYLPSSSVAIHEVHCGPGYYTGSFEPVSLPLLSTERLHLQSAGAGVPRFAKTAMIAENPDTYTRLNICVASMEKRTAGQALNCGQCWKCLQTMVTLETTGHLDRYDAVFDLGQYRRNHKWLMQELSDQSARRGFGLRAIANARAAGIRIPRPRTKLEREIGRIFRRMKGRSG